MSSDWNALARVLDDAWEKRREGIAKASVEAIDETLGLLDRGELRVVEKKNGSWVVRQWARKAVLLSFQVYPNVAVGTGGSGAAGCASQPARAASSCASISLISKSPLTAMMRLPGWKIDPCMRRRSSSVMALIIASVGSAATK